MGGQFSNQHSLAPPLNPWVKLEVTPQTINPTYHGAGLASKPRLRSLSPSHGATKGIYSYAKSRIRLQYVTAGWMEWPPQANSLFHHVYAEMCTGCSILLHATYRKSFLRILVGVADLVPQDWSLLEPGLADWLAACLMRATALASSLHPAHGYRQSSLKWCKP